MKLKKEELESWNKDWSIRLRSVALKSELSLNGGTGTRDGSKSGGTSYVDPRLENLGDSSSIALLHMYTFFKQDWRD